jgi:TolA-binding protein
MIAGAKQMIDQGEFGKAHLLVNKGSKIAEELQIKSAIAQAGEVKDLISEQLRNSLDAAEKAQREGRAKDAMRMYQEIATRFAGTQAAIQAQQNLQEMMQDPSLKGQAKALEAEQTADRLFSRAKAAQDAGKAGESYTLLLELKENYPNTEAAEKAQKLLKRLSADKEWLAQAREERAKEECENWMNMVRAYIKAGRSEKAKPYLEQIIKEYPDTSYAREAEKLLKNMR